MTRTDNMTAAFAILAFALLAWLVASDGNPADLRASWLAAEFLAQGRDDLIYPESGAIFRMHPPAEWAGAALQDGYSGELFPYVYPPLWAALLARLVPHAGFDAFLTVASVLNPLLLAMTLWLARRATSSTLSLPRWMATAALILLPTTFGAHALLQQQPQILVAFLIVLAVERDRAGHPLAAGIALAFAAALKVYPAFFVLFWVAQGRFRAVAGFVAAGAALGLLSVMLAGWPLHASFLSELSRISSTALVNGVAYNLDATLAHLFHRDALEQVIALHAGPVPEGAGGILVLAKDAIWQTADRLLLALVLAGMAFAFYRQRGDKHTSTLLWPVAILAVALVSPMAFSYHYLPAVVFAPLIADRLGPQSGGLLLAAAVVPVTIVTQALIPASAAPLFTSQVLGLLSVVLLGTGFATAAIRQASGEVTARPAHHLRGAEG